MATWSTRLAVAIAYTYARAGSMQKRVDTAVARIESETDGNIHSRDIRAAVGAQTVFHPDLSQQSVKLLTDALGDHTNRKRMFESSVN